MVGCPRTVPEASVQHSPHTILADPALRIVSHNSLRGDAGWKRRKISQA